MLGLTYFHLAWRKVAVVYLLGLQRWVQGTEQMLAYVLMEKPQKELAGFLVIIALHSLSWKILVRIFWPTQGEGVDIQILNQRKAPKEIKPIFFCFLV